MSKITIYTDGSCRCETGKGGWGAVILFDDKEFHLQGSEEHTTNNRMELLAAIKGLEAIVPESIISVFSDSTYLVRGMTEWVKGWKKREWKLANGQPMKNADLWQKLDTVAAIHKVKWTWVKAHNGDKYNTVADGLARESSQ
jgi:ribonuclease HI